MYLADIETLIIKVLTKMSLTGRNRAQRATGATGATGNRQQGATCIKADSGSLARLQWSSIVQILIMYIYKSLPGPAWQEQKKVHHPQPNFNTILRHFLSLTATNHFPIFS
jgi:hypothetical protein